MCRPMYDRQSDMENEYREKKDALAAELAQLKSFKEKYHHAIERDAVELLSKTTGLDSNKVWREMPEELRREYGLDDTYEGLAEPQRDPKGFARDGSRPEGHDRRPALRGGIHEKPECGGAPFFLSVLQRFDVANIRF